jgi:biopolymer transport protein ExbD
MKFTRNARILRSQLDVAPFATVFFLLVIFVMLGSVIYKPGINIRLPVANNSPGTDKPTVTVAMDANNRLFFANQFVSEAAFKSRLREAMAGSPEPLTLIIQADAAVTHENIVRLTLLARDAGIRDALLATSPQLITPDRKP